MQDFVHQPNVLVLKKSVDYVGRLEAWGEGGICLAQGAEPVRFRVTGLQTFYTLHPKASTPNPKP